MNPLTRQLIRASLPARRAILRRRLGRVVLEEVDGLSLVVLPEVFNPVVFRTGVLLACTAANYLTGITPTPTLPLRTEPSFDLPPGSAQEEGALGRNHDAQRSTLVAQRSSVLDMGTGSGVGALFAARAGGHVTAVDVNPEAVRCARVNALVNHLEERIEVIEGDLFGPVAGRQFDLVLFNPPFFRGAPRNGLDRAWRAEDVLERYACGLPGALAPGGRALIAFSSDGDEAGLLRALEAAGLTTAVALQQDFGNEVVTVYEARCEGPA